MTETQSKQHFLNVRDIAIIGEATTYHCPQCDQIVNVRVPEKLPVGNKAFDTCGNSPGHHYVTITHGSGADKTYQHICYGKKAGPRGGHAHGGEIKHYKRPSGKH